LDFRHEWKFYRTSGEDVKENNAIEGEKIVKGEIVTVYIQSKKKLFG
jgi:hypothetical protein